LHINQQDSELLLNITGSGEFWGTINVEYLYKANNLFSVFKNLLKKSIYWGVGNDIASMQVTG
jgi:hypothetical protein